MSAISHFGIEVSAAQLELSPKLVELLDDMVTESSLGCAMFGAKMFIVSAGGARLFSFSPSRPLALLAYTRVPAQSLFSTPPPMSGGDQSNAGGKGQSKAKTPLTINDTAASISRPVPVIGPWCLFI